MKPCEYCGQPITERKDRVVRFCSITCANKSRRKHFPKQCPQCFIDFQPACQHSNQKYCSTTCRDRARDIRIKVVCSNCGTTLTRSNHRATTFKDFFCSRQCLSQYRKKHAISGVNHPQYHRVEKICETCGKIIRKPPSQCRIHTFCSVACKNCWLKHSDFQKGSNSATWLGGTVDHRGWNWKTQSEKSRVRDNYTCQRCGIAEEELGEVLDTHHKVAWRIDSDPQTANELTNLISLCHSCHQIVEWETNRIKPDASG